MGLILTVPLIAISYVIKKCCFPQNPDTSNDSGVKQQWTVLFLKFLKFWGQKKRIHNYAHDLNDQIDRIGLVPSEQQKELEQPIPSNALQPEITDEISMSGFNFNGDSLILRLVRKSDHRTEIFLFLNLNGRGSFQLPFHPDARAYSSDAEEFSSCGLKIKCLSAMRNWRVSYNGLLKKTDSDQEMIHVKFSFIWSTISRAYDFQNDFNCNLLSESISQEESLLAPYNSLNKYKKLFNSYEQWGHYNGTITVDENEEEMHLWGPRYRNRGVLEWNQIRDYVKVYGYFKDGMMFNLGIVNIPEMFKNLKYGYVIQPNRFMRPIESCYFDITSRDDKNVPNKLTFRAAGKSYQVDYRQLNENVEMLYGEKGEIASNVHLANYVFEEIEGKGYVEYGVRNEIPTLQPTLNFRYPHLLLENVKLTEEIPFVVDFNDEMCRSEKVSGGKGSSLAKLCKLLKIQENASHSDIKHDFVVPRGIVITTSAYKRHINNHNLSSKISALYSYKNRKQLDEKCKELTEEFSETVLSDDIKRAILNKMEDLYSKDFQNIAFAVRSSASGEDSVETSAAGQMDTYLGIRSVDQIYQHVVKCWSSQFSNVAINYKRQMGQSLDNNMAVVVQEMIPAQVAGVAFTCDPVTGNPACVIITANYGLGESVVSAASEPDTFVLRRNLDNTLVIESQTVGEKRIKILMSDEGGTISKTVEEEDAKLCCLKTEDVYKIGNVAVFIEQCFGNPRDIEWAIVNNQIYLLQARPITTFDLETDYEIIHEFDTGLLTDSEYITKANIGEVMPKALSPLSLTTFQKLFDITVNHALNKQQGSLSNDYNPEISLSLACSYNHVFVAITDIVMRKSSEEINVTSYGWQLSLFGRVLDNFEELRKVALHRYGIYPKLHGILELITIIWDGFLNGRRLREITKRINNDYFPKDITFTSSHQLYSVIKQKISLYSKPTIIHLSCSTVSSLCNVFILSSLTKSHGGINDKLLVDFCKLISDCESIESMDVPNSMKDLANTITTSGKKESFLKMNPEEAVKWLEEEKSLLGVKYRKFLQQHGHRGLMEFDIFSCTWGMEPMLLIKTLQAMLRGSTDGTTDNKKDKSPSAAVEQLKLPINWVSKYLLKLLVGWARLAVTQREKSKSLVVKFIDVYRQAFRKLGELMENEGRIPDSNLIFFITLEEIGVLLKNRSAHIISKALRRRKLHKSLYDLKFPEIISGPPKPIRQEELNISNNSDWVIKGNPIFHGVVTATARVLTKFEEAENIQAGEILVTYSTDVGWTPYFPLLSGIVTELGGLLSHGAVVAREFGIPCIVGAHGATAIVRTGDIVILDGKNGTLKKV